MVPSRFLLGLISSRSLRDFNRSQIIRDITSRRLRDFICSRGLQDFISSRSQRDLIANRSLRDFITSRIMRTLITSHRLRDFITSHILPPFISMRLLMKGGRMWLMTPVRRHQRFCLFLSRCYFIVPCRTPLLLGAVTPKKIMYCCCSAKCVPIGKGSRSPPRPTLRLTLRHAVYTSEKFG